MPYVDGFIIPVPKDRRDDYRRMAEIASIVWKELGAISYVEAWADDVSQGEVTSFPRAVLAKDDETVVFSYITYPDRATRDAINAKVMEDPRIKDQMENCPFDAKRMIWGGFDAFIAL